ncbi:hypothetical protein P3T43_006945 [Paraburkholderia sp. GAS41]|uniref:AlbA family DNA-binding domain-containing protein n=1 Tax=Paraburkholderia sp. GAS41 TaxID=3035134 RepID=UPI003D19B5E7
MDDDALIDQLLYRGEGDALDFKLEQYPFEGADDESKSELLKDIIAFANSWRETTAYIVVGVRDTTREIVGLNTDLDDSRIQQFVNSKVNKPIRFEYRSLNYRGNTLGLYSIPVQERPFHANRKYGKVSNEVVYVRRGSATAIAKPDEIAKMGAADALPTHAPRLSIKIIGSDAVPADTLTAKVTNLTVPDESTIPEYPDDQDLTLARWALLNPNANRRYLREVAQYCRERAGISRLALQVENIGNAFADDVKLTLSIPNSNGFRLLTARDLMPRPNTNWSAIATRSIMQSTIDPAVRIHSDQYLLKATFLVGKVQAGDSKVTSHLYLRHPPADLSQVDIVVHSDQLAAPIRLTLFTSIEVEEAQLSLSELKSCADRIALKEEDDL